MPVSDSGSQLSDIELEALALLGKPQVVHPALLDTIRTRIKSMPPGPKREEWTVCLALDLWDEATAANSIAPGQVRLGKMSERAKRGRRFLDDAFGTGLEGAQLVKALGGNDRAAKRWNPK